MDKRDQLRTQEILGLRICESVGDAKGWHTTEERRFAGATLDDDEGLKRKRAVKSSKVVTNDNDKRHSIRVCH